MVFVLNACFLSKNVFTTLIKIHRFVFFTVKPSPIPPTIFPSIYSILFYHVAAILSLQIQNNVDIQKIGAAF